MAKYEAAPADLESGSRAQLQVVVERQKSSPAWLWKVCSAIAVVALCGAVSLLFAWHTQSKPDQKGAQFGKQITTERGHHDTLRQIAGKAKAAIHLQAELKDGSIQWQHDVGQAFCQGGLALTDNRVVIRESGLYFVYSQASYTVNCRLEEEEENPKTLSHGIARWSDSFGEVRPLLSSKRSACHQMAAGSDDAIYLGAVFQLERGDKLETETNHLGDLDEDEGKTFFGVFAL